MTRLLFARGLLVLALASARPVRAADLSVCETALDRADFSTAAREAKSFLVLHPASLPARILLARAYMGLNDGNAALRQLHEVLLRDSTSLDALYYLSKLTGILSQQEFAAVARIAPESARMHQIRAEALEAQGDTAGAEREYLAALAQMPDTAYIMNALGDLKRHERQYSDALAWYEKVLAKHPENYDALYGAGASHRLAHAPEKATPLFRRALKVDPASVAAKMALGESLLFTDNAREAVPLLEEAARADPQLRRLQYLLGRAYQSVGRSKEAERAFERYRKLPNPFTESDDAGAENKQ